MTVTVTIYSSVLIKLDTGTYDCKQTNILGHTVLRLYAQRLNDEQSGLTTIGTINAIVSFTFAVDLLIVPYMIFVPKHYVMVISAQNS